MQGFSIVETLFVVVLVGLLALAIMPTMGSMFRAFDEVDRQAEIMDRARVAMDRMTKAFRESTSVTQVTAASNAAGQITLLDANGSSYRFRRRSNNDRIQYDPPGSTGYQNLVDEIDSLYFTCYDIGGTVTTTVGDIRSVEITLTASDEQNIAGNVTLTTRVSFRKDIVTYDLVINEINYNPPGGGSGERRNEFVEIYNYGSTAIDVANWTISDNNSTDDILDNGGTTLIPAGGYGIITADPTDVYTTYTVDSSAIRLEVDDNRIGNGLSNNSETITIMDSGGTSVDAVTYDDAWGADGDGDTLERISATGGSSESTNWEESSDTGSETPGGANST